MTPSRPISATIPTSTWQAPPATSARAMPRGWRRARQAPATPVAMTPANNRFCIVGLAADDADRSVPPRRAGRRPQARPRRRSGTWRCRLPAPGARQAPPTLSRSPPKKAKSIASHATSCVNCIATSGTSRSGRGACPGDDPDRRAMTTIAFDTRDVMSEPSPFCRVSQADRRTRRNAEVLKELPCRRHGRTVRKGAPRQRPPLLPPLPRSGKRHVGQKLTFTPARNWRPRMPLPACTGL